MFSPSVRGDVPMTSTEFWLPSPPLTRPGVTASYAISVRQASALPAASFRFHLTMHTLAVRLIVPLTRPIADFLSPPSHPVTTACTGTTPVEALRAMPGASRKRPQAPIKGFLHPASELDTLGYDESESQCRIR